MHRYALAFAFSLTLIACGDNIDGGGAPSVGDLSVTTEEDTAVTHALDITGGDAANLAIALGQPMHGAVTMSGASFTYTPAENYNGDDEFTVTVADDNNRGNTATVHITISPVNDSPAGVADSFATNEDAAHAAELTSLLSNDTDPDGDTLTISSVGNATNGTVALTATDVVFTPATDFVGTATYRYTVSDGTETSDVTVTITVGGVNDAPVAVDDTGTTDEDTDLVVTAASLTTNDTDTENQTLTVTGVTAVTGGTVTLDAGTITFTPNPDFNGAASYTYTVSDGALTDTGTVAVTVTAVNDAPVAVDDTATTAEDTPVTVLQTAMLANDTDVDAGTTLTVTGAANPAGGTISLVNGDVTFTPTQNFTGAASFEYTVSDGTLTDTGLVVITVTGTNDAPVAVDDMQMTNEDVPLVFASSELVTNDIDIDGDPLTVSLVLNAVNGTVNLAGGQITFTPDANFTGMASFDYVVTDGTLTDTGTVNIAITAVNDPPIAVDDTASTNEDTALLLLGADLTTNDTDPEATALTITAVSNPVGGTVSVTNGDVTFTPTLNFNGAASFTYTVSDAGGATDTGQVAVTVTAVNDPPIASNDSATAQTTLPTTYPTSDFLANDTDVEGNPLTITAVSNPSNGATVSLTGTTITFTSAIAFTGTATFDYTVDDGAGGTDTGTVTVNVILVNVCGDGTVFGAETCDDGDTDPGDGCDENCQTENGYTCDGQPSVCITTCGDGVTAGLEECDDNNTADGDGCDSNCTPTGCGNGIVTTGEACDDGDADSTDGCTTQCVAGVICATSSFADGDRFATDPATGTCYVSFDSDTLSYAAAQNLCLSAGGYLATITSAAEQVIVQSVQNTAQNPWIGGDDIAVEGTFGWVTGEPFTFTSFAALQPDDDVDLGGGGDCLHLFNAAGEWNDTSCANATSFVVGEICEFEVQPCSDGVVQPGEQCDDGNTTDGDGCSASCETEVVPCGNGVLEPALGETCDDGNQTSGDGCSATCAAERLFIFTFTGAAGSEATLPADGGTPTGLASIPTMSRGTGLTAVGGANAFNGSNWATTFDANDYYAFTVTPAANTTIILNRMSFAEQRSGSGPVTYAVRSSLDGFTANLQTGATATAFATHAFTLDAQFSTLTAPVEFRIFAFGSTGTAGTLRIDTVDVSGGVVVP